MAEYGSGIGAPEGGEAPLPMFQASNPVSALFCVVAVFEGNA